MHAAISRMNFFKEFASAIALQGAVILGYRNVSHCRRCSDVELSGIKSHS